MNRWNKKTINSEYGKTHTLKVTFDADENHAVWSDYCDGQGIKYKSFINIAIEEKLKKLGLIK